VAVSEVFSEPICYLVRLLELAAERLRPYNITPWTVKREGKTWSLLLEEAGNLAGGLVSSEEEAEWLPIGGYISLYTEMPPPVLDALKCTVLDWQAWLKANRGGEVAQEFDSYAVRILAIIHQIEADARERANVRTPDLAASSGEVETAKPEPEFCFRRDGDGWFIRAFGKEGHFKHLKGFSYYALLIERAGKHVPMAELIERVQGSKPKEVFWRSIEGTSQKVFDDEAMQAIQREIKELKGEIEDAKRRHDVTQAEVSERRLQELLGHYNDNVASSGKSRSFATTTDKMRSAIANALRCARGKLRKAGMHELAHHLEGFVKAEEGSYVYFQPENIRWFLG